MVTFCGTPRAEFNLAQAFAFLNESRKLQLIRLLQRAGELPVYYPGDEEVYMKAAETAEGELVCALFNLGTDPIEALSLVVEKAPRKIFALQPDGTRAEVSFRMEGNTVVLDIPCHTLTPVILFLSAV